MRVPKETVRNVQVLSKLHGLDWTRAHMLLKLMAEVDRYNMRLISLRGVRSYRASLHRVEARQALTRSLAIAEHYLKTCINNPLK